MSADYDELAARAERGELTRKLGTARRGPEVADDARRMLMEATETDNIDDMYRVVLGRPPVGSKGGESPTVRTRVPQSLKDAISAQAKKENRNESDITHEALAAYISS